MEALFHGNDPLQLEPLRQQARRLQLIAKPHLMGQVKKIELTTDARIGMPAGCRWRWMGEVEL